MTRNINGYLRYYLKSIESSAWMSPASEALQKALDAKCFASLEFVQRGHLDVTSLRKSYLGLKERVDEVPVLLCPLVAQKARGGRPVLKSLLCVPALLKRSGHLEPSLDLSSAWIPRELLEPSVTGNPPFLIGTESDANAFYFEGGDKGWQEVWEEAISFFQEVTETSFENAGALLPEDFALLRDSPCLILPEDISQKATIHIRKLYERILGKKDFSPTLRNAFNSDIPRRTVPSGLKNYRLGRFHFGTMSPQYALSPSQRVALHAHIMQQEGEILAVNGPPGTGKTTLIQTVVAHRWVESALFGKEPPVLVATAGTNQAVRNIIESFSKAGRIEDDILFSRWLPDVLNFGLYYVSASRNDISPDLHICLSGTRRETSKEDCVKEQELFSVIAGNPAWASQAAAVFLENAQQCFPDQKFEDFLQAGQFLLSSLKDKVCDLQRVVDLSVESVESEGLDEHASFSSVLNRKKASMALKLEALRSAEQEQASRKAFWEAWLRHKQDEPFWWGILAFLPFVAEKRNARDLLFASQNGLSSNFLSRRQIDEYFQGRVTQCDGTVECLRSEYDALQGALRSVSDMLSELLELADKLHFPFSEEDSPASIADRLDVCVRSRLFMLACHYWEASYIEDLLKKAKAPAHSLNIMAKLTPCIVSTVYMLPKLLRSESDDADLLIVDEAGQLAPDVSLPMFDLAKKALIVGDTYQIEPVWSTPEPIDRIQARNILEADDNAYSTMRESGYAARGNLMTIAQGVCCYHQYPDLPRGLFLVEHRRCVPEIIDFCNALVYKGVLIPCRPALVPEERVLPALGVMEVFGVNRMKGKSRFNMEECKAIVEWLLGTRAAIETHYGKPLEKAVGIVTPFKAQQEILSDRIKRELGIQMQVGTVHTFQGGEREIIIFSPVYDANYQGAFFFDAGPNMLNVAVSRAKDSFLVFGASEIFDRNAQNLPSGMLGRYLRNNAEVLIYI